ncbi:hypothetical protein AVEN_83471-1 [Araneus ventricosus]|uniref:HTH CENPB-type domain-containing protein n=1 Tax=Araneus ventricosus TaxID=182803 RepID=A0A4Y2JNP2_ARAVE|nr:hypothetical protein AVEN_83471-1 [Araneus ventricosus]
MRTSTYEDLGKAMVLWFNQQRAAGIPVSGAVCAAKAKRFFEEFKIPVDFNASSVRKHLEDVGLPQKAVLLLDNATRHPPEEILKLEEKIRKMGISL